VIVRRNRFGQLEPETIAASSAMPPSGFTLGQLFAISVASGVVVWIITRMLDGRRKS